MNISMNIRVKYMKYDLKEIYLEIVMSNLTIGIYTYLKLDY